jgi:hypothetical protein
MLGLRAYAHFYKILSVAIEWAVGFIEVAAPVVAIIDSGPCEMGPFAPRGQRTFS